MSDLSQSISCTSFSQKGNVCSHLVGALNTPDVGALPPQITFFAVIISILLFQKLMDKKQNTRSLKRTITVYEESRPVGGSSAVQLKVSS